MTKIRFGLLGCLALVLVACSPSTYFVAPTPVIRNISPQEAIGIVIDATNTAAVVATQNAQATAGEQAARATSTTAAQTTRDALAVEQTQTALRITVAAAAGLATDAASVRTESAQATRAWATPTAAAIRTQAALSVEQQQQTQANALASAEFWKLLRYTILVVVAVLGIIACVLVVTWGRTSIRVAELREKAQIAAAAFKVLAGGHWAEWQPEGGYQVYSLAAPTAASEAVVENIATHSNHTHAQRQAVRLFGWWGDRFGFGIRDLGPAGAHVVSDPAYRLFAKTLRDWGCLADMSVEGQRGTKTAWADGWDYGRFTDELSSGRLVLPFPVDADPPKVAFAVPTQHHN